MDCHSDESLPSKNGQEPWRLIVGQTQTGQITAQNITDLNQDLDNRRPSDVLVMRSCKWGHDHSSYGLWSDLVLNVTGGRHHNVITTSFGLLGNYRNMFMIPGVFTTDHGLQHPAVCLWRVMRLEENLWTSLINLDLHTQRTSILIYNTCTLCLV